jgi:hypothetical protein
MAQVFEFPSSSNPDPDFRYHTTLADDGRLGCECMPWRAKKVGKARQCGHTKKVIAKLGLTVVERGDYLYATNKGNGAVDAPEPPPVQSKNDKDGYVAPMLAGQMPDGKTIADFGADYVAERKYDGERKVMSKKTMPYGVVVKGWSRPGPKSKEPCIWNVPAHIREAAAKLPDGTYDGEETIPSGVSSDVKALKNAGRQQFIVFDVMQSLGNSIVGEPWTRRREALDKIAHAGGFATSAIQLAPTFTPSKAALEKIWKVGGEGVIIKRRSSRYLPGRRSTDWIKIKREFPELVTVTGYEAGENGPYSKVAWVSKGGIVGTCKTKNNHWLRELAANPKKYINRKLWITHYGLTAKKFRGPLIWDRWEDE